MEPRHTLTCAAASPLQCHDGSSEEMPIEPLQVVEETQDVGWFAHLAVATCACGSAVFAGKVAVVLQKQRLFPDVCGRAAQQILDGLANTKDFARCISGLPLLDCDLVHGAYLWCAFDVFDCTHKGLRSVQMAMCFRIH